MFGISIDIEHCNYTINLHDLNYLCLSTLFLINRFRQFLRLPGFQPSSFLTFWRSEAWVSYKLVSYKKKECRSFGSPGRWILCLREQCHLENVNIWKEIACGSLESLNLKLTHKTSGVQDIRKNMYVRVSNFFPRRHTQFA